MPISDAHKEIRRLSAIASDTERSPDARLNAARTLLRESNHSVRTVELAKRVAKNFMRDEAQTAELRKKATSLFQFARDESETEQDRTEAETITRPPILTNVNLSGNLEEALADVNKDVRAEPMPAKFIYFPRNQPEYLIEHYTDLFESLGYKTAEEIPSRLLGDPFNFLPASGSRFQRCINPAYLKGYATWREEKFGDTLPDKNSTWYLRYMHDEAVRRQSKLGTLAVPGEQPVGAELRRRQLQSGEVQRWEIPYTFSLYFAIKLGRTDKHFVMYGDTPIQYATEFPGIESRPIGAIPESIITPEFSPAPAAATVAVARPPQSVSVVSDAARLVAQQRDDLEARKKVRDAELKRNCTLCSIGLADLCDGCGFHQLQPKVIILPKPVSQETMPQVLPKQVCSYCFGLPKSEVPAHDCSAYMVVEDVANFRPGQTGPVIRTREGAVPDERTRIMRKAAGLGHPTKDGREIMVESKWIDYREFEKTVKV
jgi:hypothetical protein